MNSPNPTLLLVENEEPQRRNLRKSLEQNGFEVTEAISAEDAIRQLDHREFDIVVCDMNLPAKTGLDVARTHQLQSQYFPGLKTVFIIYTAFPNYEACVAAIKAGAFDYILKFENNALNHLVRSCREGLEEKKGWASDPDADFVRSNWDLLLTKYGESWIAVRDSEVVADKKNLDDLYATLRNKHPRLRPYIVHLEGKDSHYA